MRKQIIIAAFTLVSVLSCEPLEQKPETLPDDHVCVYVKASQETKSSMQVSETAVSNLNVYAYRNGMLEVESYATQDEAELVLVRGASYTIYALANCGEVHAPAAESDLTSISLAPSDMAMCLREGRVVTAGSFGSSLEIPLTRLFARYVLLLDKNLENCNYRITAVQVKQRAAAVQPFASASAASQTADGDSASAADLIALNNGQAAVFYVPENCQGVLLPGNSDPWAKIPANIAADKRSLCSYLHIEGEWTTNGATADLSLNLMLGADNCSDFNIVRNSSVTITLSLSDSGTIKSSWKVDMNNLDDQRVLSFPNSNYVVMQDDGWTMIPLTVSPANLSYTASLSGSENPFMEVKVENGVVYVRGIYFGDLRPVSVLTVTTWDGKVSASTNLTLNYKMGAFTNYTYSRPDYPGQYGYLQLYGVGESDPVMIETDEWHTTIAGFKTAAENIEYHYDSGRNVEYYIAHNQRKVYIRKLGTDGGTSYVQMTQHHTRTKILMSSAVNPGLKIDDAVVCESGNLQYDQSRALYYDSVAYIYLLDKKGVRLDLASFKVPDDLLSYKNLTTSQQDRLGEFLTMYGAPSFSCGSEIGYVNETIAGANCAEIAQTGNLAKVFLYGMADFGSSYPTYTIGAEMTLASGDILSGEGTVTGKPAFPSQRYLGSFYNYQVASGTLRSNTTTLDFTSGGTYAAPTPNGVSWRVVHIDGNSADNPSAAYLSGSVDNYSEGASLSGTTLTFAPMSSNMFPACGSLGLRGKVTNPHSGKSYMGYYTLDLVLYLSFGCSVQFMLKRMYVLFVPFCEYALANDNQTMWTNCFPSGIGVTSAYNSNNYPIWNLLLSPGSKLWVSQDPLPSTHEELLQTINSHPELFRFTFHLNGADYNSLILDRSATALSGAGDWNVDGSKGYYRIMRQYDLGNLDNDKYNGLENYILEAAYDSFYL